MGIANRFLEWVYTLSTRDKYSEYDSRNSFNRLHKPQLLLMYRHANLLGTDLMAPEYELPADGSDEGVHEVRLAWRHINNWMSREYPELALTLELKCTDADLKDFQKDLDVVLPPCVKEFYKMTDGQFGLLPEIPGLIYGLKLLLLDDILTMTLHWRKVVAALAGDVQPTEIQQLLLTHSVTSKHLGFHDRQLPGMSPPERVAIGNKLRQPNLQVLVTAKQRSIPPNHVVEVFAHPMWIPLITDGVGNCIGIDLAPGPEGKSGQVILFGRDFDDKYVVAKTWGDYLLSYANDLESGNWDIDYLRKVMEDDIFIGNEGELKFVDRVTKADVPYFDVLRTRTVKQWIKDTPHPEPYERALMAELLGGRKRDSGIDSFKRLSSSQVELDIKSRLARLDSHDLASHTSDDDQLLSPPVKSPEQVLVQEFNDVEL